MEELIKKLSQLKELIKAVRAAKTNLPAIPNLSGIKPPSMPSMNPTATRTKIPGVILDSKKDPRKVAQQIKDGSISTKTQKAMLKCQWSNEDIEKADKLAENKLYHIHQGPHRITSEPVTLSQIRARHGSVQRLENSGYRLIPHEAATPTPIKKAEKPINPKDPVLNSDKFAPKAITPEKLKQKQLKLDTYLKNKSLKKEEVEAQD